MKYIRLFLFILSLSLMSCEDFLDKSPDMGIVEDEVFDSFTSVRGYLDNCIKALPDYTVFEMGNMGEVYSAAFSDEAASTYQTSKVRSVINKGTWLGQEAAPEVGYGTSERGNVKGLPISNAYYCIRITNRILEKVPDLSNLTDEEKKQLLGQAYFFRALYHFEIIKRWGGMAYMDRVFQPSDDMDLSRISYQAATSRLIEDLDRAIGLLPDEWPEYETGRPTIIAAMAMKEMAALYAASPLMKNDINTLEDNGYDIEWAKRAAEYANSVLKYIENNIPSKKMMQTTAKNYNNIFYYNGKNICDEALWYKISDSDRTKDLYRFMNIRFSQKNGVSEGGAITSPSQNLVDMYEVINPVDGKAYPFGDSRIEEYCSWANNNIYKNRDPRFYKTIIYPGDSYGTDGAAKNPKPLYLETWRGGKDYQGNYDRSVPTGYMCKKFWWSSANGFEKKWSNNKYGCVFIRTTQIYLDYAEAMNEAYGPNEDPEEYGMTAVEAINAVRARVDMPKVLGDFTDNKEKFRGRIRNERAVELMFENQRWWDIRRWMIAEDLFSGLYPIKGVEVEDKSPGQSNVLNKKLIFSKKDIKEEVREFKHRNYWYPIAKNHIEMLENVQQNPGW